MATNAKETWKPVSYLKFKTTKKYAVSSTGKLASYNTKIDENYVLKQHFNNGFPLVTVSSGTQSKALFLHQAMAHAFLKKPSPKHTYVLHLDYDKTNNQLSNLKWATKKEQIEHSKNSPFVKAAAANKVYTGATSKKLDVKKVTQLKKEIWNPKRKITLKQLAEKYGIAEMNLYRIKNGALWFHVHVEGEPIFPKYKEQLKNIAFHNKLQEKSKSSKSPKAIKVVSEKIKAKTSTIKKAKPTKKTTLNALSDTIKKKSDKVEKIKKGDKKIKKKELGKLKKKKDKKSKKNKKKK